MNKPLMQYCCWIRVFFYGRKEEPSLFISANFIHSETFRNLFPTLHVKWLPHIFNRTTCNYLPITRWDVLHMGICNWLLGDINFSHACFILLQKLIPASNDPTKYDSHSKYIEYQYRDYHWKFLGLSVATTDVSVTYG